jgi:hypothetical protein
MKVLRFVVFFGLGVYLGLKLAGGGLEETMQRLESFIQELRRE